MKTIEYGKTGEMNFIRSIARKGIIDRSLSKSEFKELYSIHRRYGLSMYKISINRDIIDLLESRRYKVNIKKFIKQEPLFIYKRPRYGVGPNIMKMNYDVSLD